MTTSVKVKSANYPALVETWDTHFDPAIPHPAAKKVSERVLRPSDGEVEFYCSIGRELRITDIDYQDARVPSAEVKHIGGGYWRVCGRDNGGGAEFADFSGPNAEARAYAHAADVYDWYPANKSPAS